MGTFGRIVHEHFLPTMSSERKMAISFRRSLLILSDVTCLLGFAIVTFAE